VHYDHVHDPSRATAWSLFLLFSVDPCVAVIPLVLSARAGALRLPFLDRWGDAVAGGVIVLTGVVVSLLGI
jgi:hypothetical protein